MNRRRTIGAKWLPVAATFAFFAVAGLCCLAIVAAQEAPAAPSDQARAELAQIGLPRPRIPGREAPRGRVQFQPSARPDAGVDGAPAKEGPDGVDRAASPSSAKEQPEQPLFQGWPEPTFALFLTGNQSGYIEPCGCTGLANAKGGLARRFALLEQIREKGWPVVPLDVGAQVRRFGRQPEIKFQTTVDALKQMEYAAVGFGMEDLRLDSTELIAGAATLDPLTPGLFVSANAYVLDRSLFPEFRVIKAGGKKIGVTAIVGASYEKDLTGGELTFEPPAPAAKRALEALRQERCDFYVLLAHATLEESNAIARTVPGFDVVLTSGGGGEPEFEPSRVNDGKTWVIQSGVKGMYVGVVGFFGQGEPKLRYERIALTDRFDDAPEMRRQMAAYQDQLKNAGLEGLGIEPVPFPDGRRFVGSKACADCHTTAYSIWENTPHAHATDSIANPTERSDIARHFDPECLSCHVTGWNAQNYYPYLSGYLGLEETPEMKQQGCENCHGPGAEHVAVESGNKDATEQQIAEIRRAMQLPLASAKQKCLECHDLDNSPDFHQEGAFEEYWKQIEHKGKD
ncbi:MAG TPA: multiheme c-type cytochrome [Pirellulaceae bacterium]|jgi:hypothetical protein|nr:multiheme c-type cytochrome [Pirellulaceae bacterium]